MNIVIYAMMQMDHQVERAELFKHGLSKHGYNNVKIMPTNQAVECDLAIFWGMHHTSAIRAIQEKNNNDWLIMERGYVGDRFEWTSLGYNGLNGHADFMNKNMPSDRWEKYFKDELKPWHDGDYILLTGQVLQDASIKHLKIDYNNITREIKKNSTTPIIFRKHPHKLCENMVAPLHSTPSPKDNTIVDDLSNAKVCVTINSNSGVDAILNGVPVINLNEGSMVWELSQHDYNNIDNPSHPDRTQWAHNIAYSQWLPDEINNGDAWDHLKARYE